MYIYHILNIFIQLSFIMANEHTIYLSSFGCLELFPENDNSKFINRLSTPILLDLNTEYEVGLVSILCPDKYYAITANDDKYNITVKVTPKDPSQPSRTFSIPIKENVLVGDMKKIIHIVNRNIVLYLKAALHGFFSKVFPKETILSWDDDEDKSQLRFYVPDTDNNITTFYVPDSDNTIGNIKEISLQINSGLADLLGFRSDTEYSIFNITETKSSQHVSSRLPSVDCGVEHMYIYTDIVHPTNFAGQLTNILDCFTLKNKGSKGFHNTVYKQLNTHLLNQISIRITDQRGKNIPFPEESTLVLLLHIRER